MTLDDVIEECAEHEAYEPQCSRYLTPRILKILKQLGVRRVLDLAAGRGRLCGQLADLGYDVVGIEQYAGGVWAARKQHPEIRFHQMSVTDDPTRLTLCEEPFDAVVSTEVVEHLFMPDQLPGFAAAALKPGAYLILSTPYHGYLKNLTLSLVDGWDNHFSPLWQGGHIKFWSRKTLTRLLSDNGFEVVAFSGVGRVPYLWKSMVLVARKVRA